MAILIPVFAEPVAVRLPDVMKRARVQFFARTVKCRGLVKWVALAVVLELASACSPPASGQDVPVSEYDVKAAFLFNFAKFVEWPPSAFASATEPVRLCVFGEEDPFDHSLEQVVQGKTANGRSMQVLHVHSAKDLKGCHILFIGWAEEKQTETLLRGIRGEGILTVGETDNFARDGGVINFVLQQNRVAFQINVDAAQQNNLKISSKLLSLAQIVHGVPERN
jgi:YfiR/HmsC-like